MQADVQNQGYAAGLAAAESIDQGLRLREIDIKALQARLIEEGILGPEVPYQTDSHPLPDAKFAWASGYQGIFTRTGAAVLVSDPERARRHLKRELEYRGQAGGASDELRLQIALVLGLLGDSAGINELVGALDSADWDAGWSFRGMHQFGASMSRVDVLLLAATTTGDDRAKPAVARKARALTPESELSHFRAMSLAMAAQPEPELAPVFAALLAAWTPLRPAGGSLSEAIREVPSHPTDNAARDEQLKRLMLAKALFSCGDHDGVAREVLSTYARSLHGVYSRHAKGLLAGA
jgi:hypothetical protein